MSSFSQSFFPIVLFVSRRCRTAMHVRKESITEKKHERGNVIDNVAGMTTNKEFFFITKCKSLIQKVNREKAGERRKY